MASALKEWNESKFFCNILYSLSSSHVYNIMLCIVLYDNNNYYYYY